MKLLIGFDGSACARAAVQDLVLAGLPRRVEAIVMSVADMPIKIPYDQYLPHTDEGRPASRIVATARALAADAMAQAREASLEGVELVSSLFPDWVVAAEVVADSPYAAIVKRAEEWAADLVVVGSHGRSGVGRVLLGSVSQNVLAYCGCSVRVARAREREAARPPRIILAVDGSENSDAAIGVVERREWPAGTEVRVLTGVDPHWTLAIACQIGWGEENDGQQDVVSAAARRADAVGRRLTAAGLSVGTNVRTADPKRFVVEEAEHWDADCIFLGARGHSRLERFMLGSVSSAVAGRAACTVEVVRGRQ
jgi:nucleotide-binding universal stress UspA family protein